MDSEICTAETSSLWMSRGVVGAEPGLVEHPCAHDDGHEGPHHCMFCGVEWNAEVTC